ncbi:MAG: CRISPR-associated helicase Cas3' [Acutalibacteraceae bacterium]
MEYYAHKRDDGVMQTVKAHLENVANLAEQNAVDMMKQLAFAAGYAHDIGKYAAAFQARLDGSGVKYEHSASGAIEYAKMNINYAAKIMLEYCIAGHHTGLPDGGTAADDLYNDVTLHARLKRGDNYVGKADYSAYKSEIKLKVPDSQSMFEALTSRNDKTEMLEKFAFFTRYLFSCLTDADFIDTEQFCSPDSDRRLYADFARAKQAVDNKIKSFSADTELQKARSRLQLQAIGNAEETSQISILNMPTGSGKTLCSLQLALNKIIASKGKKKRIIYVIPYTSIIEQTAATFEKIFSGDVKCLDILQHHSNYIYDTDDSENRTTNEKLKKACENWDAPLIITTSVQFFESLYDYKSSGLRKLHNTADSIIIFDEIHMLPVNMLQPCLRGIGYITKYLNSEAVFLSATMPKFSSLLNKYVPDCTVTELIPDKSDFKYFCKCRYINMGETCYDNVLIKAMQYESSLIIVNRRSTARELYSKISGKKYHLSTYMTPNDRTKTIAEIRKALDNNEKITVVSTSLIEAGVDFDFQAVFRQLSGLDSILQSGGRCNREGKYDCGDVYIFDTNEQLNNDMGLRVEIAKSLLNEHHDISSPECIEQYYERLYDFKSTKIEQNSIAKDASSIDGIPFRSYAESFEFISDYTVGIVIDNNDEADELLQRLKYGDYSVKRKLQKYTVSLRKYEFDNAYKLGILQEFDSGIFVLANNSYYSEDVGLELDKSCDIIC